MTTPHSLRSGACRLLAALMLSGPAAAADMRGRGADAAAGVTRQPPALFLALDEGVTAGREALKARGLEFGLTYIGEVLGNLKGGLRRGAVYQGRADLQVDADLAVMAGVEGLTAHANLYQIHGTGASRYYVGNLDVVSNIEALPATRLHELWIEQALLGKAVTVRVGKLAADAEFIVSPSATVFLNAALGWPTIASSDLPSGGAAFPLATPGIRTKLAVNETTSVMLGVYNGDPARRGRGAGGLDPQRINRDGTDFSISGPPMVIMEASHGYRVDGEGPERTGVLKAGYFHHFGSFDDLRRDAGGVPLAAPNGTGIARRRRGEDGLYALLDQTIYREDEASDRGAAAFLRASVSPNPASLVDLYLDGGLVYRGLLPGRPADVLGLSVSYTKLSSGARGADRDQAFYQGIVLPLRRSEGLVELTYQAVIRPGFTIQPDLQYVFSPGGHTWNPRLPGHVRIRNSVVAGVRATIQY